jgi:hypothetical protein
LVKIKEKEFEEFEEFRIRCGKCSRTRGAVNVNGKNPPGER